MNRSRTQPSDKVDLSSFAVLVVEDDYFIANEIAGVLRECRAEVLGPVPDVAQALALLDRHKVDCAVLDLNLRGELAFELAAQVRRRGVPMVVATGYDATMLPPQFEQVVRLEKPIDLNRLVRAVGETRSVLRQDQHRS